MQTIINYLVNQIVPVQLIDDTASGQTRNRVVYTRTIKLYKNIDNTLELRFYNQDQKLVRVDGKSIRMYLIDQAKQQVLLTKIGELIDDGSSTTSKGKARVIFAGSDLINIPIGLYNFSIKLWNNDDPNHEIIAYSDDNYGVGGVAQVINGVYPDIDTVATDSTDEYNFGEIEDNCSL